MSTNVGFATLSVIPSFDGFKSKLERGVSPGLTSVGTSGGSKFGDVAGRSAAKKFGSAFKTGAKAALLGAAGAGALAVKFGGDAIESASGLNESLNAVNLSYGKQAKAVKRLGRQAADSLGLSNEEFNSLSVRFSSFSKTIAGGKGGKKIVSTLDDLTTRASDFASVMNLEVGESAALFQSGLAGESEPLRRFGIDLSAASVEAFAYANGIAESGSKLTEAQKVQARYGSLMEQTKQTQGDFANTSDQLANSQRILSARFENAKAKLGKELLPILSEAVNFLIDHGIPAFEDFSDWFNTKGIPAIKDLGKKIRPLADELLPAARDGFKGIKNFAEDALPFAEGIVGAFNDMPGWVKKVLIGGLAGGTLAVKVGLPKLTGGLLSRGATPVNPLYVLDVGGDSFAGKLSKGKLLALFPELAVLVGSAALITEVGAPHVANTAKHIPSLGNFGIPGNPTLGGDGGSTAAELNAELDAQARGVGKIKTSWLHTKEAAEEYSRFVQSRIPREIHTTVTGWDVANRQAREQYEWILKIRSLHNTDAFSPDGSTGSTPGQPPNRSPRGGVNFSGPITVVSPNPKEFVSYMQRRNIAAASDGRAPSR